MKNKILLAYLALIGISLSSCEKGKSCMCYEFEWDTGHQTATGYYEDRASCSSTATWLGSYTAGEYYYICEEIYED